ncbi:MAG: hypothetical protein ACKOXK_04630 [Chakrabartia sp.]
MSIDEPRTAPGWVWMLRAAAAYNLLVSLPGLVAPGSSDSDRIVSLLVGCFGIIYAMISRFPVRFGPILWTGVIGKLGVLAIMVPAVVAGRQPMELVPVLAGDALFTLAFIAFLMRGAGQARSS